MKREATHTRIGQSARWLIFCAIIPVTLMATAPAGQKRISQGDRAKVDQETVKVKFDRTFRTTFTDKKDNSVKKIELRYRGGELVEIVIDGENIQEKDFQKYSDIIRKAEADAEKIKKELLAIEEELKSSLQEMKMEMKKAMEELDMAGSDAMNDEISRKLDLLADMRGDQVRDAIERARIEMERSRTESGVEMKRMREDAMREFERAREEIDRAMAEIEIKRVRENTGVIIRERPALNPVGPEPVITPKKREEMLKKLEELEKKVVLALA